MSYDLFLVIDSGFVKIKAYSADTGLGKFLDWIIDHNSYIIDYIDLVDYTDHVIDHMDHFFHVIDRVISIV